MAAVSKPGGPRYPDRGYDAYVFDLDGTIYLGDELLPGARELVAELRRRGAAVRFLSNNPTRDPEQYAAKLTGFGLPTPVCDIVNTVVTTTSWLRHHHPRAVIFAIAEEPLLRSLRAAGFRLSDDPAEIDIVVSSYDRGFDYAKLQIAYDAIAYHGRAFLVQTNPDRFCPFPGGRGEPDCAAITAAIETCTGTKCRHTFGKPDPAMLQAALSGLDVGLDQVVMVGDRVATDIAMAIAAGVDSAVVLTGEATPETVAALPAEAAPTWVLDRIDRLLG
ncbi:MAG TPA: HAD-IIA family hydrolase [Actinoplanes sp.]|nr:HAD-IIA family hydrolase [Actinoplanes sp.]